MTISDNTSKQYTDNATTIVIAGGIVLALSFGVRAVFGGIVEPLSDDLFDGRIEIFSLSIAIQNLVWGLAQPGFGMLADKYGDRLALWLGFIFYVVGMVICTLGTTPFAQYMSAGVLVGMGISGTAFGTVLAVVGRTAPEEKRTKYLGITSAIGSSGQFLLPLLVSWLTQWLDWRLTLIVVTGALLPMMLCIPFLSAKPGSEIEGSDISINQTIQNAFGHTSYVLLTAGFFVCGFHLAFITAHFPNFVQKFCVSTSSAEELRALGLFALSLAGLANIFGTLIASKLGSIYPKPYLLAAIYSLRAIAILIFISLPITPVSVLIFAVFMGGIWLSTVPLTSSLILVMFGPRAMGTLFGFVFLSHQLGSFTGVWLGGVFFDRYGSYDQIWWLSIALSVFAAVTHLLVHEKQAPTIKLALNNK